MNQRIIERNETKGNTETRGHGNVREMWKTETIQKAMQKNKREKMRERK